MQNVETSWLMQISRCDVYIPDTNQGSSVLNHLPAVGNGDYLECGDVASFPGLIPHSQASLGPGNEVVVMVMVAIGIVMSVTC